MDQATETKNKEERSTEHWEIHTDAVVFIDVDY